MLSLVPPSWRNFEVTEGVGCPCEAPEVSEELECPLEAPEIPKGF